MDKLSTFPVLKVAEIIQCLRELCDIEAVDQQILKPTPEFVQQVYVTLIERLVGVTMQEMATPHPVAIEEMENPQLYMQGIFEVTALTHLVRLMQDVRVDFSLKDLISPTKERTIRCMSAIINFAKFREERYAEFQKLSVDGEKLMADKQRSEEQHRATTDRINAVKAEIEAEQVEAQQLGEQLHTLEEDIKRLNQVQLGFQLEIADIKAVNQGHASKTNDLRAQVDALKNKNTKLKSRIVQSPEKAKKRIDDLSSQLSRERSAREAALRRQAELQTRGVTMEKVHKDLEKTVKLLQELELEQSKTADEKKMAKDTKEQIQAHEDSLRELINGQEQASRRVQSSTEKLQRVQEQVAQRKAKEQEQIEADKRARIAVEKDETDMLAQASAKALEERRLKDEVKRQQQENDAAIAEGKKAMQDLHHQLVSYHNFLKENMQVVGSNSVDA